MSRTGCCYDNAAMERFFWSLKHEWTNHEQYADLADARIGVFKYIETFCNSSRLHLTRDYNIPNQFEIDHAPTLSGLILPRPMSENGLTQDDRDDHREGKQALASFHGQLVGGYVNLKFDRECAASFDFYSRPASTFLRAPSNFLISSGDNFGRSTLIVSLFSLAFSGNGGL